MERGVIEYDARSGKLIKGRVWLFDLASFGTLLDKAPPGVVYAKPAGDLDSRTEAVRACPVSKRHVTDRKLLEIAVDLFGGDCMGDFVPFSEGVLPIISKRLAERLKGSKLTGYQVRPIIRIGSNQSGVRDVELFYLDFVGHGGRSQRWQVKGAKNLCPHCGREHMVCPGCGHLNWPRCVACDQLTLFRPDAPDYSHPKGLRLAKNGWPDVLIVEGQQWDGSDFFRADDCFCVSNRAKEWLEQTHTFPVAFQPALLNIEGVEEKFKGK
jgi:hypothetical protein